MKKILVILLFFITILTACKIIGEYIKKDNEEIKRLEISQGEKWNLENHTSVTATSMCKTLTEKK